VIAMVAVLAGALVAAAGYVVAGTLGLLVVIVTAGALALLLARLGIARTPAGQATSEVGRVNSAFSSYRRIESALTEAGASGRGFDMVTRPMLTRLLAALLADRRRVDLGKDPGAARQAIGDDAWPLLDPARPLAGGQTPGIAAAKLNQIADRLEEL
jgi:hypothetical protein